VEDELFDCHGFCFRMSRALCLALWTVTLLSVLKLGALARCAAVRG
jgi:hypothetical protein